MIDPKMLETLGLRGHSRICSRRSSPIRRRRSSPLKWAVREKWKSAIARCPRLGVRNIGRLQRARHRSRRPRASRCSARVHTGYDKESGEAIYEKEDLELDNIPYIVVIVDEMADLMMVAGKDIEGGRAAARPGWRVAAGIHVVPRDAAPLGRRHHGHHQGEFSRPASPSRSPPRSTAVPSWARWAPSNSSRPGRHALHGGAADASSRVHGPFCSDEESRERSSGTSSRRARRSTWKRSRFRPRPKRERMRMATCSTRARWARPTISTARPSRS